MANTALKVWQWGQEGTTYGTVVAATAKMAGVLDAEVTWQPNTAHVEELGRMGPSPIKAQVSRMGAGMLQFVPTYDQLQYLGHAYFGSVASSGTSGTGQFNWTYTAPYAAVETPTIFTVEFGMANAAKRLNGAVGQTFKLSVEAGDLWNGEMQFIGKDVTSTGALTSLSDLVVLDRVLKAANTALYIDGSTGTIESTQLASVLVSAELNVDTRRHAKLFGGALTPSSIGTHQWQTSLKLVMEATTAVQDIIDAQTSGVVERQIALVSTHTTNYVAKIHFAGHLTGDVKYWDDRDGNAIVETNWAGNYNAALGSYLKLLLTNGVSALV